MPQQINRLAIVFVLVVAVMIAAWYFLVPETFGELGHYRAAAVDSVAAQPVRYAGQPVCGECHDEISETKAESRHHTVACEACHGPAAAHVEDPEENRLSAPRKRGYCPLCHGYNASRPTGFPQIDPMTHNPVKACIACHDSSHRRERREVHAQHQGVRLHGSEEQTPRRLLEASTIQHVRLHGKPICVLNVEGVQDGIRQVEERFARG